MHKDADHLQTVCICRWLCNDSPLNVSVVGIGSALHKCCYFRTELGDTWRMKTARVFTNALLGLWQAGVRAACNMRNKQSDEACKRHTFKSKCRPVLCNCFDLPLFRHAKMPFLAITSRKHVGQWQSAKEEWSKCWAWLVFCLAFKKIRMVNASCIIFGWRILNYRKLGELVKLHIYLQHKQKQLKTKEGCRNTIAVRIFLRCLVCFICAVKMKITQYIFKGGLDCGRPTIPSLSLQLWSNRDQHDCTHRKKKAKKLGSEHMPSKI